MIQNPVAVVAVLLGILAVLFGLEKNPKTSKIFKYLPVIITAYFVPTLFSGLGIIPAGGNEAYTFIKKWCLPGSLLLLTLSVDLPSIAKLGKNAILLFFSGTIGVIVGAPVAYALLGSFIPPEMGDQAWKGLAALSGSWIGGGANFVAIGEAVGATDTTMSLMVIPDVAVSSVWMAMLFLFAGKQHQMDAKIKADRTTMDTLKDKVEAFKKKVSQPTHLAGMLMIVAIAFGGTCLAKEIANFLPEIKAGNMGTIVSKGTWVVLLVTFFGVCLSFTPLKKLEGLGASAVGSLMLYLLIAKIGAGADFSGVIKAPGIVMVSSLWIAIHAVTIMAVRRVLRAPIFFGAVGSQANIGAAASAPVVASAFHPSLATVGVLLGVLGYVVGTVCGLICAFLLQTVHYWLYV